MRADWIGLSTETILGGVNPEGVRYLDLFLKDYTEAFGGSVNAQCPKCLRDYVNKYRLRMQKKKANLPEHGYVLKPKFNGLQLPNAGEPVNNSTLTAEQAKILVKFYKDPAIIFDEYPGKPSANTEEVVSEDATPFKITGKTTLAQLKEFADAHGIEYAEDVTKKELTIDVEAFLASQTQSPETAEAPEDDLTA